DAKNMDKEEFLAEFAQDYGYPDAPNNIDHLRGSQFNRLQGLVYLDHAGATLYSESQLEAVFKDFNSNVYGNPHSQSDCSSATSDIVREAREQVLSFCNASPKDYKCIFTSGATGALKIIGEAFPWSCQSTFMYTMENHNSVLGIREYALNQGAAAVAVDIEDAPQNAKSGNAVPQNGKPGSLTSIKLSHHSIQKRNQAGYRQEVPTGDACNLFAFPSECNFSGVRFSLDLVKFIKEDSKEILKDSPLCKGRWMVLIDAAKGCATEPPDLSKYHADFVVISFYKLFGYPTGLGALIVRNEAAKLLKKTYFSGGTVAAAIADFDFVMRRERFEEMFEDGTTSFLSVASIRYGFRLLNTLSMPAISRHTTSLATYLRKILLTLRHENGVSLCKIYGEHRSKVLCNRLGPTVAFNMKRSDGSWYGYREVEKLASLSGIQLRVNTCFLAFTFVLAHIVKNGTIVMPEPISNHCRHCYSVLTSDVRTGCFCNPGACAKYLCLSHLDLISNIEAGHTCWDDKDVIDGRPTGAVRVSFGYMSTFEDAKKFIDFLVNSFLSFPKQTGGMKLSKARPIRTLNGGVHIRSIVVYPIKSCEGFSVESWPLSNTGLWHDREWLLKSLSGEVLTQKKVPEMRLVSTYIDLNCNILFINSPHCKEKLKIELKSSSLTGGKQEINLNARRYRAQSFDDEVDTWFSTALGRPCTLLRCSSSGDYLCMNNGSNQRACRNLDSRLNFVNEAQLLLVSEESVADLNDRLTSKNQHVSPMRFRPNLIVSGGEEAYLEDTWRNLKIGDNYFTSLGGCNRCQMINLYHEEGQVKKSKEPLATLASYRRFQGKILFGILLRLENGDKLVGESTGPQSWLQVGQEVLPNIY
ncbi:Molybdenum cofactor sulfurase, C-terminal, partial [Dillenia turbinata]